MNPEARAVLDAILAKDPASISEHERAILQARRSYLSADQLAVYDLDEQPATTSPYAEMNKASLRALLADREIEFAEADTKAQLISLLEDNDTQS